MARGVIQIVVGGVALADYNDVVDRDPVDGGPVVDEVEQPFADNKAWFARGNFKGVRPMTLTKEFATNKLAWDFFELAAQTWNGVSDVLLTHKDYDGAETTYQITAASVRVVAAQPIGVTVISKVTITGGLAVLAVSP